MDANGTQYWSDVINIIAHEDTAVAMPLELLALQLTNDPAPDRFDGEPPVYEKEPVLLASLFDIQGILVNSVVSNTGSGLTAFYFINDHLGTPQVVVDEAGTVVWEGEYEPFGAVNVSVEDRVNNFRFAGQYFDQETELHYNYFRYYSPDTGRYLNADPSHSIQPDGIGIPYLIPALLKTPQALNNYSYASNHPSKFIDPLGLVCFAECWRNCIDKNYGSSFDVALGLSFIGVVPIVQNVYNGVLESIAKDKLKALIIEGAATEGNIIKKLNAAEKAAKSAKALSGLTKSLSFLSKASGLVSAAATGYVVGATGYCAAKCK